MWGFRGGDMYHFQVWPIKPATHAPLLLPSSWLVRDDHRATLELCVGDGRTVTVLHPSVTSSAKPLLMRILSLDCYVRKDRLSLKIPWIWGSICYCNLASSDPYICGEHWSSIFGQPYAFVYKNYSMNQVVIFPPYLKISDLTNGDSYCEQIGFKKRHKWIFMSQ